MNAKNTCNESIAIDKEIVRIDKLTAVYQNRLAELAQRKSSLFTRKNELKTIGCCSPIATPRIDPLTNKEIGMDYEHAAYCKRKTDKLEVR